MVAGLFCQQVYRRTRLYYTPAVRGSSSVGRASASQAEGREFEPRLPLHDKVKYGDVAEWLGNGLQNRPQQFDSARRLHKIEKFGRIAQLVRALR